MSHTMLAHTGLPAGGLLDGATHPIFGLDHLLAMVAVGVLAAFVGSRRVAWSTPAGFVAGMLVGGLLGLVGVEVPAVEIVIAASLVVLGLAIAPAAGWVTRSSGAGRAPALGLLWLPAVAALFGLAHGHAHGAELPDGAVPGAYIAGFLAVTAVLHLCGIGVGSRLRRAPVVRAAAGTALAVVGTGMLVGV